MSTPASIEMRLPRSWREDFLAAFQATGSVRMACTAIGIARTLVYRERARNAAFAKAWNGVRATLARPHGLAPNWRDTFLRDLRETGNATHAMHTARVSRTYVYAVRRRDPAFAVAWTRTVAEYVTGTLPAHSDVEVPS